MLPRSIPRLSKVWIPSGGFAVPGVEDAHSKLVRAGFLRQSHAGIFHMLPLGKRVQDKVERLVAKHMEESLGQCSPVAFLTKLLTPTFNRQRLLEYRCLPFQAKLCGSAADDCRILHPRCVLHILSSARQPFEAFVWANVLWR